MFKAFTVKAILFLKEKFKLTDKLTLMRHVITFLYGFVLVPILFQNLSKEKSIVMMFIVITITTGVFLIISKGKKREESFLLNKADSIIRKKPLILFILLLTEQFLLVIYYENNYSCNKYIKKIISFVLLIIGSLVAGILWAMFNHSIGSI